MAPSLPRFPPSFSDTREGSMLKRVQWWNTQVGEEETCLCPQKDKQENQSQKTQDGRTQTQPKRVSRELLVRHGRSVLEVLLVMALVAFALSVLAKRSATDGGNHVPTFSLHRSGGKLMRGGHRLRSFLHQIKSYPHAENELPIEPEIPLGVNVELERALDIYCRGPLLHTVQTANVFADSKYFVDMPIKANSSAFDILVDFQRRQLAMTNYHPNARDTHKRQLRRFIDDHFDPPGTDLLPITPFDYQAQFLPPMVAEIQDGELRDWAFELHKIWQTLGRIHNPSVKGSLLRPRKSEDPSIYRPANVLIVPGGRFRESYYWDSYWIVQGLLVSDMPITARGIVNHLLEYVSEFGFVPNGGRIYYLTRSQPPMLSDMVGGVQTTTTFSGQQWDSPNAWPPEQDIVVEGLLAVNTTESHSLARMLSQTWTQASLSAWKQTGLMYEKYNATEVGGLGTGGEYFPQFGFGWTNGVILKFLTIHQNLLYAE
ncbi:hypothetical protein PHYBOEH_003104 [Phytophthora boehmeriae]|uniref:Alpha,alpha-trehalose glucohydrolase n=1 Tax=Phytophthora boehmeriae TaxID=109152 RepID=A0A8T1WUA8_9STRA|nr:hypothetical protein PHYBOEH_003104 [Phytophthora boehmeriae]